MIQKQLHHWKAQPNRDNDWWKLFAQLAHSLTVWKSLLWSSAGQSLFLLRERLQGIAAVLPDISSLAYSWVSWASQFLVEEISEFWGNCWTLPKNLLREDNVWQTWVPYMELSSGLSKKMWRKSLRCSRNPKTSEVSDMWDVQQGNLRALNETSPERSHICYRQLSWKARAT